MSVKKKILTAIDGSEHSVLVIDKTIEFARVMEAQVVLVHCHKKFPAVIGQPDNEREIAEIIGEAEQLVEPFTAKLEKEHIDFEIRLMEKPARTTIPEVARIEKCDLIIMGSRGLTNLEGMIVGSVTNRVLQIAPCSVLVVR